MPKIQSKKHDYKIKEFSWWLKGKMASKGITQTDLAEKLNITQSALSQKISSGSFDVRDLMVIFDVTNADDSEILNFF